MLLNVKYSELHLIPSESVAQCALNLRENEYSVIISWHYVIVGCFGHFRIFIVVGSGWLRFMAISFFFPELRKVRRMDFNKYLRIEPSKKIYKLGNRMCNECLVKVINISRVLLLLFLIYLGKNYQA